MAGEEEPPDDSAERAATSRTLAVIAIWAAAVSLLVSFVQGPPSPLPAVALGWPLILYLERAALIAGVIVGVGGTADRLLRGDPLKGFSAPGGTGLQFAERTVEEAAEVDETIKEALDAGMRELDERVSRLEEQR